MFYVNVTNTDSYTCTLQFLKVRYYICCSDSMWHLLRIFPIFILICSKTLISFIVVNNMINLVRLISCIAIMYVMNLKNKVFELTSKKLQ